MPSAAPVSVTGAERRQARRAGAGPGRHRRQRRPPRPRQRAYFIAGQFHPELKSRPNKPAPLFVGLVDAAKKHRG